MERQKAAPKPVRYYAPNDKVRVRLMDMGSPRAKIYEAKEGETWDKFRMKPGEYLGVLDGLRGFGGAVKIELLLENGATLIASAPGAGRWKKGDAAAITLEARDVAFLE